MESITYQHKPMPQSSDPNTFSAYECAEEQLHSRTMALLGQSLDPLLIEEVTNALAEKIYKWLRYVDAPEVIQNAFNSTSALTNHLINKNTPDTENESDIYDQLMSDFIQGVSTLTQLGGPFFEDMGYKELKPYIYK